MAEGEIGGSVRERVGLDTEASLGAVIYSEGELKTVSVLLACE